MSAIRDLTAALNRLAAAVEAATVSSPSAERRAPSADAYRCGECGALATVRADHADTCSVRHPHPALLMPSPKGHRCAAGCGHGVAVHREAGCDVADCECHAPYGRLMPAADVPDDISTITEKG